MYSILYVHIRIQDESTFRSRPPSKFCLNAFGDFLKIFPIMFRFFLVLNYASSNYSCELHMYNFIIKYGST